jgi:protein-S-isoprenylcysteine O-methyltransferase Ste14
VRHPSYSGYFLMFLGLALMVNNPTVLVPMMAVAGYVGLVDAEERLLLARFKEEYKLYMGSVGRFIPRLPRSR